MKRKSWRERGGRAGIRNEAWLDETVTNPLDALMELHDRLGLPSIAKMPGKRWAGSCGPWRWLVNGSSTPIKTEHGDTVGPCCIYIEYNGWPAGILGPDGEGQFAAGEGANADTFAAALAAWDGR